MLKLNSIDNIDGTEQTLIVVKPDGFKRQLTGKILARFEEKGICN